MSSKRFKKLPKNTNTLKAEPINNLLSKVKGNCTTKFDESLDINILINNKQKKNEINLRSMVNLPSGTGKKVKVAVVCEDGKLKEAKDSGADLVGGDDLIEKIKNGEMNFEKLICSSSMMIKLSKLGKVLGPKGLMPNPKVGTVTPDVEKAVDNVKKGQVQFRTDKGGILHCIIGKLSFQREDLLENMKELINVVSKLRPASAKGIFLKKISLSSTMGPGLTIDVNFFK